MHLVPPQPPFLQPANGLPPLAAAVADTVTGRCDYCQASNKREPSRARMVGRGRSVTRDSVRRWLLIICLRNLHRGVALKRTLL